MRRISRAASVKNTAPDEKVIATGMRPVTYPTSGAWMSRSMESKSTNRPDGT